LWKTGVSKSIRRPGFSARIHGFAGIERKPVPIPNAVAPPSCSIRNTSPFSADPGEGRDCGTAGVYALWLPGTGKS
jgi:hypothetical protein